MTGLPPPLLFASEVDRRALARSAQRGRLVRLATGIYSSELHLEPEQVVRRRLWQIVAHAMPGAVIVDRSGREGGAGRDGRLYVVAGRIRPLVLTSRGDDDERSVRRPLMHLMQVM